MRHVRVPALDRDVSAIGFGCASLGSRISVSNGRRALDVAYDLGVSWYDVAPPYGDGEAESHLGHFLQGRRDKLVICTKFGIGRPGLSLPKLMLKPIARRVFASLPQLRATIRRVRPVGVRTRIDPAAIEPSVVESLRRLRTDYIDVLAIHDPMIEDAGNSEVFNVLERLKRKGWIRSISVAGSVESIGAAMKIFPHLDFVQFADGPSLGAASELRMVSRTASPLTFVTHSVFGDPALKELSNSLLQHRSTLCAYAGARGLDATGGGGDLLLDFAFANNPDGVVITSMFSRRHIERNCMIASREPSPEAAERLIRLLRAETTIRR